MKFRKGPSAVAVGFTQASVSAKSNPLPEVIDTPTTVSEIDEATIGSIIRKADDAVVTAFVGEAGATKADAPLIADMNTIHKNAIRRYIFVDCIGMV